MNKTHCRFVIIGIISLAVCFIGARGDETRLPDVPLPPSGAFPGKPNFDDPPPSGREFDGLLYTLKRAHAARVPASNCAELVLTITNVSHWEKWYPSTMPLSIWVTNSKDEIMPLTRYGERKLRGQTSSSALQTGDRLKPGAEISYDLRADRERDMTLDGRYSITVYGGLESEAPDAKKQSQRFVSNTIHITVTPSYHIHLPD